MTLDGRLNLHAWLISGESQGTSFLADVWRMLAELAVRAGGNLEIIDPKSEQPGDESYFGIVRGGQAEARLRTEIGLHRAQSVPEGSSSRRVETSLVGVEFVAPDESPSVGRPSVPILKTYDYVGKHVTHHASGRRIPLSVVLAGQWEPETHV